ncbi:MAG: DUF1467 family protein [Rhodobiaceae bacterium]|nr:DUF1467 family protein [Rhodobiaceae bacterium]
MSLFSALAIYFVIWWLVLFTVLPFGVRTQEEEGEVEPGSAPSAPARPRIAIRLLATSLIAALVFGAFYSAFTSGWLDMVIPPRPGH